jgi:phosphatidylserine decarboxylase
MAGKQHNHLFSIGFSVVSDEADPDKVPLKDLMAGLFRRLREMFRLSDEEAREVFANMGDTYEMKEI